ncbi:oxidoreductase [Halarcobacter ebronensis]|uniref:Oxidoreductase n=1 Tax=Halarcobacter ebronensis TaxID=1462615 RepID=A0A4Q0Y968_9BACT|nr:Gfo/Idh/MocA family oxidoreductase [Halarcobacter ebronensis]RXJ66786.1 oxidoreductase [Halarcobacter ebronensis]
MLNIAIIGLGAMGRNHYRILKESNKVNIAALCDVDTSNTYDENFYTDVESLIENENIDAAIVAVPTFLHHDVAIKLIKHKIPLLIEKPVASTLKEAEEILKAAKEFNVKVAIGHVERFNPVVKALKDELKDKEIYSINITRVGPFPPRIADVGVLTDLSVHDIDLTRYITHKNIMRKAIFKSQKIHNHYEDNAIISFELENDVIVNLTTNWLTPFKKRTIEVACKEAYYEANLITQDLTEYSQYHTNNSYVTRNCFVKKDEPLKKELQEFIKFVQGGNDTELCSIEDSMITLEIANQEE